MQEGCTRLLGEHDFRNLCKLDPAKQITNFKRHILRAQISPVSGSPVSHGDDLHVLDLVGTAFLYHQVRHIMAVLFLIGTGLEHPSVVTSLLNVNPADPEPGLPGDASLEAVNRKPEYQMADALPLMLWDCAYRESDVQWRADDEDDETIHSSQSGIGAELYHQLHSIHARGLIHTEMESHFLSATQRYHPRPSPVFPIPEPGQLKSREHQVLKIPLGGGTYRRTSKYIPLLSRKRLDSVELMNERYRLGKGERKGKRLALAGEKTANRYEDEEGE
jgi:tRNA pseudouridine38/39 synthase